MRSALTALAALAALATLAVACAPAASPEAAPPRRGLGSRDAFAVAPVPPVTPARYLFTQEIGVLFEDAEGGSASPRREPAIVDGARVLIDGGIVVAKAPGGPWLTGFRSLPPRLGGGYLMWSGSGTYRAADFLGELTPVTGIGASGGVRPWLSTAILRTERGLFEVDPVSLAVQRPTAASLPPGTADGLALDARRAVRVDMAGRASFTVDGGASWTDITEQRGMLTASLLGVSDSVMLVGPNGRPGLRLGSRGDLELVPGPPAPPQDGRPRRPVYFAPPALEAPQSRSLPPESVAHAAAAGALLPGGLALVARQGGLRLLALSTARPLADVDLTTVAEGLARCQPVFVGGVAGAPGTPGEPRAVRGDVLLACSHARGAHVLRVGSSLSSLALEATFPDPGAPGGSAGFIAGPRGRFAFAGRCGRTPPTAIDFRRSGGASSPPDGVAEDLSGAMLGGPPGAMAPSSRQADQASMDDESRPDPPPDDAARVCVRVRAGQWIERRLTGDDARHLYRWIPGDDGQVTALLLMKGGSAPAPEGVRIVRIDPRDPALQGGLFPAIAEPSPEPPYRAVDPDFQLDEDGSIRGWIHLPQADGEQPGDGPEGRAMPDDKARGARSLPVAARVGGRTAGVRIDREGRVTVYPLPPDTVHVARGGSFGFAVAGKEEPGSYFESTDGGRTWLPVEGPPARGIDPPADLRAPFGCSAVGCSLGGGLVRLGWGGPRPAPATTSEPPAAGRLPTPPGGSPEPLRVTCSLESEAPSWPERGGGEERGGMSGRRGEPGTKAHSGTASPARSSPPITLWTKDTTPLGTSRGGSWSAAVLPPFQPGTAPRTITLRGRVPDPLKGAIVPILTAGLPSGGGAPVDLLLTTGYQRLRLSGGSPALLPQDRGGSLDALVDVPGTGLVALGDASGVILTFMGDGPAREAFRLMRVPDPTRTRFTLARRLDGSGLALVGYSTSSSEVFAGALDLGRAEVGPLRALGSLGSLAEGGLPVCRGARLSHRFLAEIPVLVRLTAKSGREIMETTLTVAMLLRAGPERLCLEGLDARLPQGDEISLSATFMDRALAVVRGAGTEVRASCSLEPAGGR